MEKAKCEGCDHTAIRYHGIDRHFAQTPDKRQIYSDYCQEPECRCERAKIVETVPTPAVQRERSKWAKVVASVLG